MRNSIYLPFSAAVALACLSLTGCQQKKGCMDPKADNYDREAKYDDGSCVYTEHLQSMKEAFMLNYADIAYTSYLEAYDKAVILKTAIDDFVANPTTEGYTACRQAWFNARELYVQTEAFRYSEGPIDDAGGPWRSISAWPIRESYIDYVTTNNPVGIINDTANFPVISESVLASLNEQEGEGYITTGYHVIEFLLWGKEKDLPEAKTKGPRPFRDYLTVGGTASNQARRGEYLKACAALLVSDLAKMADAWDPDKSGNYRASFLAMDSDAALTNILGGMATLCKSELAGRQMSVALDSAGREKERSGYSDNTHRDIILGAKGIRNIYTGTYVKVDKKTITGRGIKHLLYEVDADLEKEINTIFNKSVTECEAITAPFDNQAVVEAAAGSGPLKTAIATLRQQGDLIGEAATALDLSITIPE